MASFSNYASRFLSSGLATSIRQSAAEGDSASDPLFYSQASVAPFSNSNRNIPYAPEYSMSSSDGLPPLASQQARPGSQGASRFGSASFMGAGRGRGVPQTVMRDSAVREIDDEEDVDLWRSDKATGPAASLDDSEHRHGGQEPRPKQVQRDARHGAHDDSYDPFLQDGDLDADSTSSVADSRGRESTIGLSSVASPSHIYSQPPRASSQISPNQSAGKARGWLAHGSVADYATPTSKSKGKQRRNRDSTLSSRFPNDIYQHPDEAEEDGLHGSSYHHKSVTGSRTAGKSRSRSQSRGLYSIYDERSDSELSAGSRSRSSSISASSVTESGSETDNGRRSSARKASKNVRLQLNRNRTRNMSSTMRDPLLPPGASRYQPRRSSSDSASDDDSSESMSDPEGSGFRVRRDKEGVEEVAGVYIYPAPPARSGWGPWANRLAVGKYKDKTAILCFAGAVAATVLFGLSLSWGVKSPAPPKTPNTRPSSYYTITRSLPILIMMTLLSFGAGLGNLMLLRNVGRLGGAKVLRTGLMGVPVVLGLGWTWALAGSFIYDDESWSGGSWSTTGLRIISIIPLVLAIIFAQMVWSRRKALSRSIAVVELSCNIVLQHPALLALAVASLGVFLVLTIPFLFIFTRLFLVGHFGKPVGDSMEWQTDKRAAWLAWATLATWLWTWAVLRGVQRVTVAGVVSHWYFNQVNDQAAPVARDRRQADDENVYREEEDPMFAPGPSAPGAFANAPPRRGPGALSAEPDPTEIVRASFARATGPALGSICLAALILSVVKTLTAITETARRISKATVEQRTPRLLQPLTQVVAFLAGLTAVFQRFSDLALVYVGVTGDGFWTATKKSAQLACRRGVKGVMEGLIINLVLDLTAIALSFLCGIAGFLFSAHQLHVPADAPLVGLLCAIMPYWTLRLCADVLTNAADTLYLCYAIDHASNDEHCPKAAEAFTTNVQESVLPF